MILLITWIKFVQVRIRYLCYFSLFIDNANNLAAPVANRGRLQNVAEIIHLQRERVLNARIGRVALVAIGKRLSRMREEHRVPVAIPGLQSLNGEVLLGD